MSIQPYDVELAIYRSRREEMACSIGHVISVRQAGLCADFVQGVRQFFANFLRRNR